MLNAYKYRIYPTKAQAAQLACHFGCARHVYNWALAAKDKHYQETGKSLSKRAIQDAMVLSKKMEFPWLCEVNSQSLLATLDNLDRAFLADARNFLVIRRNTVVGNLSNVLSM